MPLAIARDIVWYRSEQQCTIYYILEASTVFFLVWNPFEDPDVMKFAFICTPQIPESFVDDFEVSTYYVKYSD